jgi:hypothetical protein
MLPPATEQNAEPKPTCAAPPSVAAVLKPESAASLRARSPKRALWSPHTVRSIISRRLGSVAKVRISRTPDPKRGLIYWAVRPT